MQHESAKWRPAETDDDAPTQQPMAAGLKPAQRKAPTQDQKKVRREMARKTAADERGRTHDICANPGCGRAIHDAGGIDPNVPWVHTDSGNSKCDVGQPADAVMLQGVEMPEAEPMYRNSSRQVEADINQAGDRSCSACGHTGAPTMGDTGPVCRRCGSYSLQRAKNKPSEADAADAPTYQTRSGSDYSRAASAKVATQIETNVASADGRVLLNPGDAIRMPNGLTVNVKNVRRHETSLDHYYVDTDAGTTVVPYSTKFQVVPSNSRQLSLPDYGTPGGNFNYLPGNPQHNESSNAIGHDEECPSCGRKGTMSMHNDKYTCTVCGYGASRRGGTEFSDNDQVIKNFKQTSRNTPTTAIAKRAALVLATTEGDTL